MRLLHCWSVGEKQLIIEVDECAELGDADNLKKEIKKQFDIDAIVHVR